MNTETPNGQAATETKPEATTDRITPAAAASDPFDLDNLRLSQDFSASLGVRKKMLTVPVKKPSKEWWVRTHPDADNYWIDTTVLDLKEDREVYMVMPSCREALATESTFGFRRLVLAINRQSVLFVWPLRMPGEDGKIDDWSQSAGEAAELARDRWVRVTANMSLGAYDVHEAAGSLTDPEWPDKSYSDILKLAFKNNIIDSLDHPVLQRLRGEA